MPTKSLFASRLLLPLLAWFLVPGCQNAAASAAESAPLDCTLVLIKTGPRKEPLTKEENTKIFAGHFGNMERMAREGHLLVAGPFGEQKSDATLRGLFVLDTGNRAKAIELAETDPGFQAGVFALAYHDLSTRAPLRECLASVMALSDAAKREGRERDPGEGIRGYVLLTAKAGEAAQAALSNLPGVLILASLDQQSAWAVLDAADVPAALKLVQPVAASLGECTFDAWYATGELAKMQTFVRH
jgi:uncharacterized protein YciI